MVRPGPERPAGAGESWIRHILDASVPEALDTVVKPIYRGLREDGFEYFKVDALRHLRYEGYNAFSDHFREKGLDVTAVYRRYVQTIRDVIGRACRSPRIRTL